MTIQQPTSNHPRANNGAAPKREDAEYQTRTPGERRAWADGYRLGRTRGRIDAWQEWTGHTIPGADPRPPVQADPSRMIAVHKDGRQKEPLHRRAFQRLQEARRILGL